MIGPPYSCSTLARITPSWITAPLAWIASNSTPCVRRGAEGACIVREVKLSLERRSWLNRRDCIMDLSDVSKRMETKIDVFVGDLLSTFSAVRIDYMAQTVTLEDCNAPEAGYRLALINWVFGEAFVMVHL